MSYLGCFFSFLASICVVLCSQQQQHVFEMLHNLKRTNVNSKSIKLLPEEFLSRWHFVLLWIHAYFKLVISTAIILIKENSAWLHQHLTFLQGPNWRAVRFVDVYLCTWVLKLICIVLISLLLFCFFYWLLAIVVLSCYAMQFWGEDISVRQIV